MVLITLTITRSHQLVAINSSARFPFFSAALRQIFSAPPLPFSLWKGICAFPYFPHAGASEPAGISCRCPSGSSAFLPGAASF